MNIQDGFGISPGSYIVQMIKNNYAVVKTIGIAYRCWRDFFLSAQALKELKAYNDAVDTLRMGTITKTKSNCRVYMYGEKQEV